jgi:hypothetical protein
MTSMHGVFAVPRLAGTVESPGILLNGYSSGGPITTHGFIGTMLGLLFAAMYVAVNAAAIGYFLGPARSEFNVLKHIVVPVLGILAMVVGFLSALGGVSIPILGVDLQPLPAPYNSAPLVCGIWMLIGLVAFFVLRSRSPEAVGQLGAAVAEG